MVPNLDLILLAFLHGSFISCILLLVIFLTLICLLLAFSIALFSIVLIDSYHIFSLVSLYFGTLRANVEMGFAIGVFTLMHFMVNAALDSKPLVEGMVASFRLKAQHVMHQIKAFMLAKLTHQL
ncbi:Protein Tat like [Actinidia chinensis var. chinensis]|uniref:Protein Tat like n=1 Tax=Actinidia chinensis var. chinensis TaxID=1590841 RepID=A0A2R6QZJ5_ACTCC|nr:Protein Tat like [Actinidia chinensis var. chinensis]